ncbi:MAG: cytochrome c oxidase subunit II [Myxococcota bacterium]|nr:cytochrome c oxidase subunit II [Myxococcota bacterium]
MLDYLFFYQVVADTVSSYANDVDNLILMIGWFVSFWLFAAEGVFFALLWLYRKKDGQKAQYISGEEAHQKRWVTIPHLLVLVCDVFIIVGAVRVWVDVKQTLPPPDSEIRVTAQQWAWSFQHPGADNVLDTDDDIFTGEELRVSADKVYHFHLGSKDVMHDFSVPVFRLKQDAIPGRVITGWFKAEKTGTYDIQCAEMCGIGHGLMPGRLVIETPEQHMAWVNDRPETKLAEAKRKKTRELAKAAITK